MKVKNDSKKGLILFVLHSHLPLLYYPEYNESLEERWLYEAVKESYIPLLMEFEELDQKFGYVGVTISFSGSLLTMLTNDFFKERIYRHLKKVVELGEKEVVRTKNSIFHRPAEYLYRRFSAVLKRFEELQGDILKGYKQLAQKGSIQIITSNLTHCISPFYFVDEENTKLLEIQFYKAVSNFVDYFGFNPEGVWLPECAYTPQIDKILKKYQIKYTFLESHGIIFSRDRVRYGTFFPYLTKEGIVVFGRDLESSKQVWSAKEGYPGDFWYREFYKDIGYELDYEYIKDYIHESGIRTDTGYKYYRITGADVPLANKEIYDPELGMRKAFEHAANFIFNRERQSEYWHGVLKVDAPLSITAMYDTELFGHWWFEGTKFLRNVVELLLKEEKYLVGVSTVSDYIKIMHSKGIELDKIEPNSSTWGWKGYFEYWLNGSVDYMYRHLHTNTKTFVQILKNNRSTIENNQECRRLVEIGVSEILQAQCSDWAFIVFTGQVAKYGHQRFKEHILNIINAINQLQNGEQLNNKFSKPYEIVKLYKIEYDKIANILYE
ncbi:MAG: 1,4-alpha-glucan branching protein domain-containing protein [bacterium]